MCVEVPWVGLGGSTGFWWLIVVLVSVSKILSSAFHHLVSSGVSSYSCLWLGVVPLVIPLFSTNRLGRLALFWVSVVRALSAGKLSSCREGDVRTCLLAEDKGLKQGLSQKLCSFCSPHSHLCRLISEWSGNQDPSSILLSTQHYPSALEECGSCISTCF